MTLDLPLPQSRTAPANKENVTSAARRTAPAVKPTAPTTVTHASTRASTASTLTSTLTISDIDPEYETLMALKLATKDTKYDFKAQLGVAKEFTQRAKNLMRDMRRALADSANAVDAAVANSRAEMDAAANAAEEARRERDDASRALDAARAEAQASAAHLAAAAKREAAAAKAADRAA